MKRSKKIMLRVLPVLMILMVVLVGNLSAVNVPADPSTLQSTGSATVNAMAKNIWGTVALIVQILAIAAIVFAGVRYMFASADAKADIKQQTIILLVGALLVFAAVPIINFVTKAASDVGIK